MEKRGKQKEKYPTHICMIDFYDYYSKKYFKQMREGKKNGKINQNSVYYVPYSKYCKIISEFNICVKDMILYEHFEFNMPEMLGMVTITKKQPLLYIDSKDKLITSTGIDWNKTNKLWETNEDARNKKKVIRFMNKHTNGFIYKINYFKSFAKYKNKSAYKLNATRTFDKDLAKILKSDMGIQYLELPQNRKKFYK